MKTDDLQDEIDEALGALTIEYACHNVTGRVLGDVARRVSSTAGVPVTVSVAMLPIGPNGEFGPAFVGYPTVMKCDPNVTVDPDVVALVKWRDGMALDWHGDDLVYHVLHHLESESLEAPPEHKTAHTKFMSMSEEGRWQVVKTVLNPTDKSNEALSITLGAGGTVGPATHDAPPRGKWVRLERGNDWGRDYLAMPGQAVVNGTADARRAVGFANGSTVRVRWPDGSETVESVVNKRFPFTVGDHGHDYSGMSELPGFEADVRGAKQWVPLDAVEVWVSL